MKSAWRPEGLGPATRTCDVDSFRHSQAGRPGAGVRGHFLVGRPHWTSGYGVKGGPVAAGADWLLGWADTVFGLDVEE